MSRSNGNAYRNGSGYYDPTASKVLKHDKHHEKHNERVRLDACLEEIFDICYSYGFHVEERIVLKDLKTGKIHK